MIDPKTHFMNAIRGGREAKAAIPDDEPNELLAPMTPALPSAAPNAPKRLHKRLKEAGWEVWIESSRVRVGRVYFKSAEKAGLVKKERHEVIYWQVRARLRRQGKMVAAFAGTWKLEPGEWVQKKPSPYADAWVQKMPCVFIDAFRWDANSRSRELVAAVKEYEIWMDDTEDRIARFDEFMATRGLASKSEKEAA